jgi:hypothetical protein
VSRTVALLETWIRQAAEPIEDGQTGPDNSAENRLLDAIAKAWESASGHAFTGTKRAHGRRELAFAEAMLKRADPQLSQKEISRAVRKLQPASRKDRAEKKP